jgi:hypothetical protein
MQAAGKKVESEGLDCKTKGESDSAILLKNGPLRSSSSSTDVLLTRALPNSTLLVDSANGFTPNGTTPSGGALAYGIDRIDKM